MSKATELIKDIADELYELRRVVATSDHCYLVGMPHVHKAEAILAELEREVEPVKGGA